MTYPSSIIDVSDSELWDSQDGINGKCGRAAHTCEIIFHANMTRK